MRTREEKERRFVEAPRFRPLIRPSQDTHYVIATETNRLMIFGETVAVYCENHTEHRYSPYLTGNILRLRYRDQPVVWGKGRYLL
jgi:hypothetical protein